MRGGAGAAALAGFMLLLASRVQAAPDTPMDRPDASRPATGIPYASLGFYTVFINERPRGQALLLRLGDGTLLARARDWEAWSLVPPSGAVYEFEGEPYYALGDAPGFRSALDEASLEARLDFDAAAFRRSQLSASRRRSVTPQPPAGLGGFFNYEFVGTHQDPDSGDASTNVNSLLEAGVFNGWGVGTSQWLGLNLTGDDNGFAEPRDFVRLETAWTRDQPETMQTLRIGDGVGAAGLWGRPLRYGGVRWSRNFETQPGFVTVPQAAISGETALPSVLDIYVDGLRRQSVEVPAGPFQVEDLPTFSGQGEVSIVVRDLLGREQLIAAPYITGTRQLKEGLHDFSYEAGVDRREFGRESNEYGDWFAASTHRYGFSDDLTGEARAEAGADRQALGMGAAFSLPPLGVVSNAFAVSNSDQGIGTLNTFTFQHNARRGVNLGVRLAVASERFTQLGLLPGAEAPRRNAGANLGLGLGPFGTLGLAYIHQEHGGAFPDTEAVTSTYTYGFRRGSIRLLGVRRITPNEDLSVGLALAWRFGSQLSSSAGYTHSEPKAGDPSGRSYARLQRNLPRDEGYGYRVGVSETHSGGDASTRGEVGGFLNAAYGSYGLEASTTDTTNSYRGTVRGGFGAMGGHGFASRRITQSFAIVETGAPDIALSVNHRPAATTDSGGVAVLPYLSPYRYNSIRVDTQRLPLDVEIGTAEVEVAPYFRSGVVVKMDAQRSVDALVTLLQSDGTPVPAGAVVSLTGSDEEFPVAKDGRAYLTGLHPGLNAIEARWNGTRCPLFFDLPDNAGIQHELEPLQCQEQ